MRTHFKTGQNVTHNGKLGVVHNILNDRNACYPVQVAWKDHTEGFTLDGRKFHRDNEASLFVVDIHGYPTRKAPKTKTYWLWVNRKTGSTTRTFRDEKGFSPKGGHLVDAHAKYGSHIRWEDYRKMEWTAMELEDYCDC